MKVVETIVGKMETRWLMWSDQLMRMGDISGQLMEQWPNRVWRCVPVEKRKQDHPPVRDVM